MTLLSDSCKQHLAPLTTLRASVVREILSRHTTSINIAILRRLLRVLAIFLLRQPPDLQIFCWMILFQGSPRTHSHPFCTPTSRCSESAYRSKVAKSILGAKYRLSREQHVAEENVLQSPDSNLSGRCLLLSRWWTFAPNSTSSPLYFFPFGIRCPVLPSTLTWQFHKRSHACPIRQIITGCLPLICVPNRICSPSLNTLTCFSPTSQVLGQLAPLLHLRDGLPLVSSQRPSDSSSSP